MKLILDENIQISSAIFMWLSMKLYMIFIPELIHDIFMNIGFVYRNTLDQHTLLPRHRRACS